MRVVLVAEQLRRPVPGGIGTYVRGLAAGLQQCPDPPAVEVVASRGPRPPSADPVADLGGRLHTAALPSRLLVAAWDRGLVPVRVPADVVHATSLVLPPKGAVPLTAMVHDLAWRHYPEAYPRRGRRWHEAALQRALRRADVCIVPSGFVGSELEEAGGKGRVEIIEEGCDHLPAPDAEATSDLLRRLGVGGPYVLSVSTLEPRKNLARLARAYAEARRRLPEPWPLVVVGPEGWGSASARLRESDGVVLAGRVPDPVLAGLYAGARLFVYVPLEEGWGLPVTEAMRAAAPVVASPVPSAGSAARTVDPFDTEAIAAAIVEVAGDESMREALVASGRARAAALTWAATAARHVELWQAQA